MIKPTFGEVLLDDKNIEVYSQRDYESILGFVDAKNCLMNFSTVDNILLGNAGAKNEEILGVCRKFEAAPELERLDVRDIELRQPDKLLAALEENEYQLS